MSKISISSPRNTIHGHQCYHTSLEDIAVWYVLCLYLASNQDKCPNHHHNHLNNQNHRNRFGRRICIGCKMRQQWWHIAKTGDSQNTCKENIHCSISILGKLLVCQCCSFAINIRFIFRITNKFLEPLIFLQVLATAITPNCRSQNTAEGGRNGNHQHIPDCTIIAWSNKKTYYGNYRHGNRWSRNTNLRRNRSYCHWSLRPDALLDGNVINNRHNRIHHMPRAAKHGQQPGSNRRIYCNALRIGAQKLLRILQHDI